VLLWCGIAAPLSLIVFVVWAAAVTPDYSHVANTISQLAAQRRPYPAIMGAGFVVFGLLVDGFSWGLYRTMGRTGGTTAMLVGLLVFGTSVTLSGFAQDYNELPDVPHNLEGHLHSIFAQIAVIGLLVGMFFQARSAHRRPEWQIIPGISIAAAVAVTGFGLMFTVLPASIQGLLQRGLYAVTLLWLAVVAVTAMRAAKLETIVDE
jgi:hypothetical membrane protein